MHIDHTDTTIARIAELERQVRDLQTAKLQIGSGLSGARWSGDDAGIRAYDGSAIDYGAPSGPGVTTEITAAGLLFAAKLLLQTAASGARIVLDSSVPVIDIIDAGAVARAEIGNLGANGGSGAGYKLRANDATGAPVFDSDQIFGDRVMKSLGIANAGSQSFTSTSYVTITGTSLNFSVPRPCNIYAPFVATGRVNTNNGNVGFVRANLVGVFTSGNENFGVLANFAQTSSGWIFVTGLAAGSYTIRLEAAVNNTPQTFDAIESAVQVFQLGG